MKSITVLEPARYAVCPFPDLASAADLADLAGRAELADEFDLSEDACVVLPLLAGGRLAPRSGPEAPARESPGRMLK